MRDYLKVVVAEEDIRLGMRGSCYSCPIARAMRRAIPGMKHQAVHQEYVEWEHDGVLWQYELPDEAAEFVFQFDSREPVRPFVFKIPRKKVRNLSPL